MKGVPDQTGHRVHGEGAARDAQVRANEIEAFARMYAGTPLDLDAELEEAAVEYLFRPATP